MFIIFALIKWSCVIEISVTMWKYVNGCLFLTFVIMTCFYAVGLMMIKWTDQFEKAVRSRIWASDSGPYAVKKSFIASAE